MRTVVDTNVLVSFLTDRHPEQQAQAAGLFSAAAAGENELLVPQLVVTELVFVLTNVYGRSNGEAASVVHDLLETPGAAIVDPLPWLVLFELWPNRVPGFADAVVAAVAAAGRTDAVATFDRPFARRLRRLGIPVHRFGNT